MINTLLSSVLSNYDKSIPADLLICKKGVITIYDNIIIEDFTVNNFLNASTYDLKLEGHDLITLTELEARYSYFTRSENGKIKSLLKYGFKSSLDLLSDIKDNNCSIYNDSVLTAEDYVYDCPDETYELEDEIFICIGNSKYKAVVKKIMGVTIDVHLVGGCMHRIYFNTEPHSHNEERLDYLMKVHNHNKVMYFYEARRLRILLFENYLSNFDRLTPYLNE